MNAAETNAAKVEEILESLEIEPINSGACGGEWIPVPSGRELDSSIPPTAR